MDNERMGRFIAEQRKAKGMTQLDLANKLHITDKAISKWERGLSSPDVGLLLQLADEPPATEISLRAQWALTFCTYDSCSFTFLCALK